VWGPCAVQWPGPDPACHSIRPRGDLPSWPCPQEQGCPTACLMPPFFPASSGLAITARGDPPDRSLSSVSTWDGQNSGPGANMDTDKRGVRIWAMPRGKPSVPVLCDMAQRLPGHGVTWN